MTLQFELVSPEKQLRSGDVHQVVVPGSEGDFAVLEGHAPFMSTIRPGAIDVYETTSSGAERIFIEGGFAEVTDKGLTILAEHAQPVANIDVAGLSEKIAAAEAEVRAAPDDAHRELAEKKLAVLVAKREAAAN
jgi:F-type H+-transporting ATPase subunit epsilon|tara:strand:+ start:32186 stop:32587 length:402 start_codon:yes stop_codon:yes gene_type:complete